MSIFGLNFFIQNVVLTVSWRKNFRIFPNRAFFRVFLTKCLSKCMSQIKEKCDPLALSRFYLWIIWRCHWILRVHRYYFCLEPTVRKDTWMRKTSINVTVILFESSILKVTWSQLCSKFLFKNYKPLWKQHFERCTFE